MNLKNNKSKLKDLVETSYKTIEIDNNKELNFKNVSSEIEYRLNLLDTKPTIKDLMCIGYILTINYGLNYEWLFRSFEQN